MLTARNLRSAHFGPLDLDVAAGDCVAIQGPSSAGKSLLLRAIADLDPNQGELSWNGQSREAMTAPQWRKLVGLVPAESGWWTDRVGDHFEERTRLPELLQAVGLQPDALNWDVARLSTGERHRLAIIRCLAQAPSVLLLDEPTAALDIEATGRVESLLRQRLEKGAAILLVTHDSAQTRRLASRTVFMKAGQISEMGTTAA